MPNTAKKITISRALLSILQENHANGMKVVFSPDACNQRITRLIDSSGHLFEVDLVDDNGDGRATSPKKAILAINARGPSRVCEFIGKESQGYAKSSDDIGFVIFGHHGSNIDEPLCVYFRDFQILGVLKSGLLTSPYADNKMITYDNLLKSPAQVTDRILEFGLFNLSYQDNELMTFDELLKSPYQVLVTDMDGNETELNADSYSHIFENHFGETDVRDVLAPDDQEYDQYNPHPEHTVDKWVNEVVKKETYLGYGDWVIHKMMDAIDVELHLEKSYLGYDQAIDDVLSSNKLDLLRYTVSKVDKDSSNVTMTYEMFLAVTSMSDLHGATYFASKDKETLFSQTLMCLALRELPQKPGLYNISESPEVWMSNADVKMVASLPELCDGFVVGDLINELTDKEVSYQGNGAWEVDIHHLGAKDVARLLLRELCIKTPEDLSVAMERIRSCIEDREMSPL